MDWREKVARTSGEREADNRLSAISAMLTWAVERGHHHRQSLARLPAALSRRPKRDHLAARARRRLHGRGADRDAAGDDPRLAYRATSRRSVAACHGRPTTAPRSRCAKARRGVANRGLRQSSIPCTSGLASDARRHGAHVAADPHHEDRAVIQEALFRAAMGRDGDRRRAWRPSSSRDSTSRCACTFTTCAAPP